MAIKVEAWLRATVESLITEAHEKIGCTRALLSPNAYGNIHCLCVSGPRSLAESHKQRDNVAENHMQADASSA